MHHLKTLPDYHVSISATDSRTLALKVPRSFSELEVVKATVELYMGTYALRITLLFCYAFFVLQVGRLESTYAAPMNEAFIDAGVIELASW